MTEGVQRWHLRVWLRSCSYGEMYQRLSGDATTAQQFERLLQKMLVGLEQERLGKGDRSVASASALQVVERWEQLPLIQ